MSGRRSPTCSPTRRRRSRATAATTWREFDRRADGVAGALLAGGRGEPGQGRAVPLQLPRVPRVDVRRVQGRRCVPVNTNYRYADDELVYLWDNADAVAVVFHGAFADRIERIRDRVPNVTHVALGRRRQRAVSRRGPCRTRTRPRRTPAERTVAPWGRERRRPLHALHGRHHRHAEGRDVAPGRPVPHRRRRRRRPAGPASEARPRRGRGPRSRRRRRSCVPACPLMHGTGVLHTAHR